MPPRRLQAPSRNGGVLAEPSLHAVAPLLTSNRQRLAQASVELLGQPFSVVRARAKQAAVAAAQQYLSEAGEPIPLLENPTSLLMAGHQPELFHPGVWVKNFALTGLARAHGLTPINLVIDNDTVKNVAVRMPLRHRPTGEAHEVVSLTSVPFDRWQAEVPYEERPVQDETLFADFAERAEAILSEWDLQSLLPEFWTEARRQAERTPLLGERLAAARRVVERRWGCHNLELPVSRLCATEPFACFALHLLQNLPQFHAIYNDCVHEYRRTHGIRSKNHPVPDLAQEASWREAPFWAWRAGSLKRARLFVRADRDRLDLRAGQEPWPALPFGPDGDPRPALQAWRRLESEGFKIRSRALTNTLFARLFLSDLFIHGIGGAKYDELTDEITRRFYRFEPPEYLVLSATLWLPLPAFAVDADRCHGLAHKLRDIHYNPQRHFGPALRSDPEAARLILTKQEWIAREPTDAHSRRERFQLLRELAAELRRYLFEEERRIDDERQECERQLQANAVLQRRDFAFCLYPEAELRPFCQQFLSISIP
jgi:hypothetical protein